MDIGVIKNRFGGKYQHIVFISMLVTTAILLHALETMFVSPVLWFRIGFANIITLIAILVLNLRETLLIVFGRVVIGSFIIGTFVTPSFFFSFSGGMVSACGMWLLCRVGGGIIGVVGISIFGALLHNITQLLVAYALFIHSEALLMLVPILIIMGVVSGTLNGFLSGMVLKQMEMRH